MSVAYLIPKKLDLANPSDFEFLNRYFTSQAKLLHYCMEA